METTVHHMKDLFDQLGLPSEPDAIESFIAKHQAETNDQRIEELDFWSPSQAEFLRQARCDDADWAEVVDELSARLNK